VNPTKKANNLPYQNRPFIKAAAADDSNHLHVGHDVRSFIILIRSSLHTETPIDAVRAGGKLLRDFAWILFISAYKECVL